jgi:protein-disulfide isomerase
MITRRQTLQLLGTTAAAAFIVTNLPAQAQNVSVQSLAVQGPLGDIVLGPADAKVTIVEYAAVTCPHCAAFHNETWPELKKRYVDTGKVRFILRGFTLNPFDRAGFMLARCDGDAKYYPLTDLLFEQQQNWAFVKPPLKPLDALRGLMRQAGFSQEKFDACLTNQKLRDAVDAVAKFGAEQLNVNSTPTFFINGQRRTGNMSIVELEKIIEPLLGK